MADTEEINAPDLEDTELDNAEAEPTDDAAATDEAPEGEAAEEDGPLVVSFGEDEPETEPDNAAPEWVRDLRRTKREQDKRIKELEAALENKNGAQAEPALGPKPTLESCDWETDVFERRLEEWHDRKREVDASLDQKRQAEQQAEEDFNRRLAAYNEAKAKLPVDDFDDAEAVLLEQFDATQQGLLVKLAKAPALFAYALGKNPTKAKALAAIKDPVDFIAAAVRMETEMKQTKRAPAPEKVLGGGVPGATAVDNRLEVLRAEAARTNDYTKLNEYKQKLRNR